MEIEHRVTVAAPPDRVSLLWSDVAIWLTWDPDTKSVGLDGPFETGSTGRLTPTKVTLSGLLAWLIGPMLVKQLNAGLPVTLANLKRGVEEPASVVLLRAERGVE